MRKKSLYFLRCYFFFYVGHFLSAGQDTGFWILDLAWWQWQCLACRDVSGFLLQGEDDILLHKKCGICFTKSAAFCLTQKCRILHERDDLGEEWGGEMIQERSGGAEEWRGEEWENTMRPGRRHRNPVACSDTRQLSKIRLLQFLFNTYWYQLRNTLYQ